MNDFKTRLSEERTDLENRVENLNAFLVKNRDDKSATLTDYHLAMLDLQLNAMFSYLMILNMRINDLKLEGVEKVLKNDKTLLLYRGEWDVNIAYQRYDMVYYERVAWTFDSDLSDTTVAGMIPTLKNGWKVEN